MNRDRLLSWIAPILLFFVAAAVYSGARDNGVLTEDTQVIWGNPAVTSPTLTGTLEGAAIYSRDEVHPVVRPLTVWANSIRFDAFGRDRASYLWTQILLLAACGYVLFGLIRQTTGSAVAAVVTSVLFVGHAGVSQSVLQLAGLSELSSLLFGLLSLGSAYLAVNSSSGRAMAWASILLLAIALGFKETAFVFAPVVWLLLWSGRESETDRTTVILAVGVLVTCVAALGYRMVALSAAHDGELVARVVHPDTGLPLLKRAMLGFESTLTYLRILIWPDPLSTRHDSIVSGGGSALKALIGVVFVIAGLALTALAAIRKRLGLTLWSGLLTMVLIATLGVLAPAGDFVNERFVPFLLAAALGLAATAALTWTRPSSVRMVAAAVPVVLAGIYGWLAMQRVTDYKDQDRLMHAQLADYPNSAYLEFDLGNLHLGRGQYAAAQQRYESALGKREDLWAGWVNLGASYSRQQEYGLARRAYNKAIEGMAGSEEFAVPRAKAHFNRALALMRQDQNHLAVEDLQKTLEVFPDHLRAHANLGFIYRNSIKYDEQALYHFGRAIELEKDPTQRASLEEAVEVIHDRAEEDARRRQIRIDAGQSPVPEDESP